MWDFFRWWNSDIKFDMVLMDGDRDVGYLNATQTRDDEVYWVSEWAAPGVSSSRIWSTVRVLAERSLRPRVEGRLRKDQLTNCFVTVRRTTAIPMVAPLGGELDCDDAVCNECAHFGDIDHF